MIRTAVRRLCVVRCHLASTASRVHSAPDIVVTPRTSLIDEKVHIHLQGLQPNQIVRLVANVNENNVNFESSAVFMADQTGVIDLDNDASLAGTYTGKDPMGLFWSLEPCPGQGDGIRLVKKDVTSPIVYNLQIFRETAIDPVRSTPDIVAEVKLERLYMKQGVKRVPVKEGRFRGTIFIPEGSGPFPGLTDMFGGIVSLVETRAALLASHGYATFAISYLYSEGLPQNLMGADDKYIRDAAQWFFSRPYIDESRIGAVGLCFGGCLSLMLAAYIPQVRAVVNINGIPIIPAEQLQVHNKCSAGLQWPKPDRVYRTSEGAFIDDVYECDNPVPIPAWQHGAKVLNVVGEDDKQVHPKWHFYYFDHWPQEYKGNLELRSYPGAGHLLEPPYAPYTRTVKPSVEKMKSIDFIWDIFHDLPFMTGGYPKQHAFAQEDSWKRILEFLNRELGT